ncbi:MAG TPA: FUSC family protein, partial [Flavobacteriaceae bacterium]|nr:FUSC family protein [Flavobacteriaceae bacterium]
WYVVLVLIRQLLFPKSATEYFLSETLEFTADYLEIRAKLINPISDRKTLIKDLLDKQNQLTENHETLRELLLHRRLGSGKSYYQARRLLILRQAIDMLELAMANPVNYGKTDQIFKNNPGELENFQEVMYAMSERLKHLSKNISNPNKIESDSRISDAVTTIKKDVEHLIKDLGASNKEDVLALKNYWKYQNSQFGKIRKIEHLIYNRDILEIEAAKKEDRSSFLTKQDYNLEVLKDNFNIESSIFRHSLRIAVVAIIGYGLGLYLNLFNAYWILMTVIIIMRPNYGLTKERFKDRSIGTIIGAGLAFSIITLIHSSVVYATLAILCYTTGLSMVQRNYKAAAAFITMHVLFLYALLNPEVFTVIQYRVLDTLIGASLAFLGSWILWPYWEIKSIDKTLKAAIKADREYLAEIGKYYNEKGEVTQEYKLSRKTAFLALSDLNASFQRMTQEPKAQHKSLNEVFQIVMLMHSFLASLASLGTYMIHNKTTPASDDFNTAIKDIQENLMRSEEALESVSALKQNELKVTHGFDKNYKKYLDEIAHKEQFQDDWEQSSLKEEAHLLSEQLKWLTANSQRMAKIIKKIHFE